MKRERKEKGKSEKSDRKGIIVTEVETMDSENDHKEKNSRENK